MAAVKCITVLTAVLATPVAGNMADLLSVVNTIEQKNTANADLISEIRTLSAVTTSDIAEPTPLRAELFAELRGARELEKPKPSAARLAILSELRAAREEAVPKPSSVRLEVLAGLREARELQQPKPSAVRLELLAELRSAREQATAPSSTRQALLEELRGAREQAKSVAKPSAVRNELLSELREAREEAMLEKFLEELEQDEEPAKPSPVRNELLSELRAAREKCTTKPSPVRNELLSELRAAREDSMLDKFLDELESDAELAPVYTDADELPWDDSEELLDSEQVQPLEESASTADSMDALNRVLRTLLVSAVALGLAAAAKLPELDLKKAASSPSQWVTLALFFVPLALVSADYAFDVAIGNEFGLISACWGLAAAAAMHLRGQEEKAKIAL